MKVKLHLLGKEKAAATKRKVRHRFIGSRFAVIVRPMKIEPESKVDGVCKDVLILTFKDQLRRLHNPT